MSACRHAPHQGEPTVGSVWCGMRHEQEALHRKLSHLLTPASHISVVGTTGGAMEGAFALDPEQYNWEDGASGGERPLVEWSVEDVCLWVEELGLVGPKAIVALITEQMLTGSGRARGKGVSHCYVLGWYTPRAVQIRPSGPTNGVMCRCLLNEHTNAFHAEACISRPSPSIPSLAPSNPLSD